MARLKQPIRSRLGGQADRDCECSVETRARRPPFSAARALPPCSVFSESPRLLIQLFLREIKQ
jgi:hypothetical protein